jgi:hypothetical protein
MVWPITIFLPQSLCVIKQMSPAAYWKKAEVTILFFRQLNSPQKMPTETQARIVDAGHSKYESHIQHQAKV